MDDNMMAIMQLNNDADKIDSTIDKIADTSIKEILKQEQQHREHTLGQAFSVYDNRSSAEAWVAVHYLDYKNPLCIRQNGSSFSVDECILEDADGILIHDGDIVFLPDDTFFRFKVSYNKERSGDVWYEAIPVDGHEDHFPKHFPFSPVQGKNTVSFEDTENVIRKSEFRLRAWDEEEKKAWLEDCLCRRMGGKSYKSFQVLKKQEGNKLKALGSIVFALTGIMMAVNPEVSSLFKIIGLIGSCIAAVYGLFSFLETFISTLPKPMRKSRIAFAAMLPCMILANIGLIPKELGIGLCAAIGIILFAYMYFKIVASSPKKLEEARKRHEFTGNEDVKGFFEIHSKMMQEIQTLTENGGTLDNENLRKIYCTYIENAKPSLTSEQPPQLAFPQT